MNFNCNFDLPGDLCGWSHDLAMGYTWSFQPTNTRIGNSEPSLETVPGKMVNTIPKQGRGSWWGFLCLNSMTDNCTAIKSCEGCAELNVFFCESFQMLCCMVHDLFIGLWLLALNYTNYPLDIALNQTAGFESPVTMKVSPVFVPHPDPNVLCRTQCFFHRMHFLFC